MNEKEKAILVGVNLNNQESFEYEMQELANLAHACGFEVSGKITQKIKRISSSHYIGKGKISEIISMSDEKETDTIIFNDELTPSQIRNIEKDIQRRVIDRTSLILDIFSERARTKEAQLQVEIASLQYMLPRLIGLRESLGRQVSGVGLSVRGAGEKKLELDRREIEKKISVLNRELEKLTAHRKTQRKRRKKMNMPVATIVGYTNAGKSTLMNAMLELFKENENKPVFEEDMLFATLQTSVRSIKMPDNKKLLLTDTVGFVSKLPHYLIKAFRSTLEEVKEADLLIHVVDYSNPEYEKQINITNATLKELGVNDIPMIYAYNKTDLLDITIPMIKNNTIYLSAKNRIGINELLNMACNNLFNDYIRCEMLIPYDCGGYVSYFQENANVLSMQYETEGIKIAMECKIDDFKRYSKYVI
mgnify:CR=1 FL=1